MQVLDAKSRQAPRPRKKGPTPPYPVGEGKKKVLLALPERKGRQTAQYLERRGGKAMKGKKRGEKRTAQTGWAKCARNGRRSVKIKDAPAVEGVEGRKTGIVRGPPQA